jgi:hypothetical protein
MWRLPGHWNRLQQAPEAFVRVPHGGSSESNGADPFGSATDHQHNMLLDGLDPLAPSPRLGLLLFLSPCHIRAADGSSPCRLSVQSGNAQLWHSPEAVSLGATVTIPVTMPPSSARLRQCNWIGNPHVLRQLNVNRWFSWSSTLSRSEQLCSPDDATPT